MSRTYLYMISQCLHSLAQQVRRQEGVEGSGAVVLVRVWGSPHGSSQGGGGPAQGHGGPHGGPGVPLTRAVALADGGVVTSWSSCTVLGESPDDALHLLLLRSSGQDRGVAEHTVVQSVLGLLGFLPVAVLDQGDPMSEIEVEVVKRTVLHAESTQSGPVNLSCQVLEKEPGGAGAGGAHRAQVGGGGGGGAPVTPSSGAGQAVGGRPAGDGGGGSLLLGRLRPGLAPEVLSHLGESVGAGAGRQSPGVLGAAGHLLGGGGGEAPGGGAQRVVGVRRGAGGLLSGSERGDDGAGGDTARGHGGVLCRILHLSCPLPGLSWDKLRDPEVVIIS